MIENSCAFTGHRPQKLPWRYDESAAGCVRLKAILAEKIAELAAAGNTDFFSGMAEGTDTWAALAVLALRAKNPTLKLHCILPYKGQADQWTTSARELYNQILGRADDVIYVNEDYHKGCMLERNRYLVDHAAKLLAVYNGERRVGTAMTVRYAQRLGRQIFILNPDASPNLLLI